MKLGIHSAAFVKDWEEDITPYIKECHSRGYKVIEISLLGQTRTSAEKIAKLANDLNVSLTCTTGLSEDEDISDENLEKQKKGIAALKNAIEICEIMNSNILSGVVHSKWGISSSYGRKKELKFINSSNCIKEIIPLLENKGIRLAIEPLNRYETDFVNTVDQGLYLSKLIDSKYVGLLLDVYHMNIEEKDICLEIQKAKEKLFHLHIAGNDRGVPRIGSIDWKNIFKTLKSINYSDYIVIEMFFQHSVNTSKDLFAWREIEKDIGIAIKEAKTFIDQFIDE